MKVEPRVIYNYFNAGVSSFDFDIRNVPFEPDYMVIKSLSIYNNGAGDEIFLMRSNLTNKYLPMLSFDVHTASYTQELDLRFPLGKLVDGTFTFEFIRVSTGGLSNLNLLELAINIEFIKEN